MKPWEVHPALVHFPIAFWIAAIVLELHAIRRPSRTTTRVAYGLLLAGVVGGVLAAAFGLVAFLTLPAHSSETGSLMYAHLGLALGALVLFSVCAVTRWPRRAQPLPMRWTIVLGLGGMLVVAAGFIGGHIVYRGGAGVAPDVLAPHIVEEHAHGHRH